MSNRIVGAAVVLAALLSSAARAEVVSVGRGTADASGAGVLELLIDPKADPEIAAGQIRLNLQLSNGAVVDSVTVAEGLARVSFSGAPASATVEATLPTEIAAGLGLGPTPVAEETRRRGLWWITGAGAAGGIAAGLLATEGDGAGIGSGGSGLTPVSPLE